MNERESGSEVASMPEPMTRDSRVRHESCCGICSHSERQQIEKVFVDRQISIAEITKRYGVGHDALYRHAHAINLLAARNRNRGVQLEGAGVQPATPATSSTLGGPTPDFPTEASSTAYSSTIIELLDMPASDKLLMAIERSVEKEAERVSSSLAVAANHIFVAAALVKIAKPPDSWLMWFQDLC